MSIQDTELSHSLTTQDIGVISHESQDNRSDILECLSVLINDGSSNDPRVEELVLDEQLLGTTLTAVTLPDGTQAFVANHFADDESESKDTGTVELGNGETILLRDASDFTTGKSLQLELNHGPLISTENAVTDNQDNTHQQLEIIDGTAYMVTSHINVDDDEWEIEDGKLRKKDAKAVTTKVPRSKVRHPCPREGCSKVYSTLHHLKVHERSHTGQRPYRCSHPKCKKSFSTGYSLKAHLRTHTGEKPYKCPNDDCDKSFKTSGDLLKHIRTHTGERPFVCSFEGCGRSFTTSNIRKVHLRTHTGERPYKCTHPKCGKAFASATNYKNHIRIHSGEKPYVCSIENCGRRFTEYSSLYKHHLVHTQQRPFECKLCFRRYRQSSTLIMHKRTAHSVLDCDDGELLPDESLELSPVRIKNRRKTSISRESSNSMNAEGKESQVPRDIEDLNDNETQILFVGDASQIAALQKIELNGDFDDPDIDTSFEGLNVKIEDIGLGWN